MRLSSRYLFSVLMVLAGSGSSHAAFSAPSSLPPTNPAAITSPADNEIVQFDLGNNHSCAVMRSGALLCWGDNRNGQTGNTDAESDYNRVRTPALVFARGTTAVSAAYAHTCAIVDGSLHCWGWNYSGQIGNGKTGGNVVTPVAVIARNVRAVSTGSMHSCAVVGDALQCWGDNTNGQIGNGVAGAAVTQPTQVIASGVQAVSAGGDQTCAIVKGALYCWGRNRHGQIGNGPSGNEPDGNQHSNTDVLTPTRIFDKHVSAVAAGNDYTCAIVAQALYCWGKTDDKGIGPNARSNTLRPTQMIARDVSAVAVGTAHTCAIVKGSLQCWGYNGSNVIGTGPSPGVLTSPTIAIAGGVTAVSAGESHTCALVNGALRCRGYDAYGQIAPHIGYLPFTENKGDIRTLDHAEADRITALKKAPAHIAGFINNKLIEQDGVIYLVTAPQAFLRDEYLALDADVIPVYALQIPGDATGATPGELTAAIADNAVCGEVADADNHLSLENVRLQQNNRFINLKEALAGTLPVLPTFSEPAPLGISASHAAKTQSCARSIMAKLDALPYRSITLQGSDAPGTLPLTLDEITSATVSSVSSITVAPSAKATAEFRMQAQVMAFMQCGDNTLYSWKVANSAPWNLPREGNTFQIDEDLLAGETPDFPAYTQQELRRAINENQHLEGLAPVAATTSCRPVLGGTQFILMHGDTPVKTLALFSQAPTEIKTPTCDDELPMLALLTARDLGYPVRRYDQFSKCKAWPNDKRKSIVALSYLQAHQADAGQDPDNQSNDQGNSDDGMGDYDLDVLIINSTTRKPLARLLQKAAIASDAWRFSSLGIDTARYRLAPDVRAFGVRTTHSSSSRANPAGDTTLYLYIQQQDTLRQVVNGLVTSSSRGEWDTSCAGEFSQTERTIEVGQTVSHGLADLQVRSITTASESRMENDECVETPSTPVVTVDTLSYDGKTYVIPETMRGF